MVAIVKDGNKLSANLENIEGVAWNKVAYSKLVLASVLQDSQNRFIEVNFIDSRLKWKIADVQTWQGLESNMQQITLPVTTVDGLSVTSLNDLYSKISDFLI